MGEAPTDHCGHGPIAPHLINSKHTKLPLPVLVLLSIRKSTIWLKWQLIHASFCSKSKCHIIICHSSGQKFWSESQFLYTFDQGIFAQNFWLKTHFFILYTSDHDYSDLLVRNAVGFSHCKFHC